MSKAGPGAEPAGSKAGPGAKLHAVSKAGPEALGFQATVSKAGPGAMLCAEPRDDSELVLPVVLKSGPLAAMPAASKAKLQAAMMPAVLKGGLEADMPAEARAMLHQAGLPMQLPKQLPPAPQTAFDERWKTQSSPEWPAADQLPPYAPKKPLCFISECMCPPSYMCCTLFPAAFSTALLIVPACPLLFPPHPLPPAAPHDLFLCKSVELPCSGLNPPCALLCPAPSSSL